MRRGKPDRREGCHASASVARRCASSPRERRARRASRSARGGPFASIRARGSRRAASREAARAGSLRVWWGHLRPTALRGANSSRLCPRDRDQRAHATKPGAGPPTSGRAGNRPTANRGATPADHPRAARIRGLTRTESRAEVSSGTAPHRSLACDHFVPVFPLIPVHSHSNRATIWISYGSVQASRSRLRRRSAWRAQLAPLRRFTTTPNIGRRARAQLGCLLPRRFAIPRLRWSGRGPGAPVEARGALGDRLTPSDGTGRVALRPAESRDRRVLLDHEPREPGQVRKEAAVAGIRLRAGVPCDPWSP